ncbi:MAG: 5'-methylthioadenosine/adenosylhomocysteine nucleosidase [Clostridia bacterium]|nr:5'-methylthioadenosine/adenosylhomocysteine nucleosidase [Clostridia bacterium]
MLGIIGAMDLEVNALRDEMRDVKEQTIGFTRYYTGTLQGEPLCLARCGVGKVHAALCAQGMILALGVTRVLNIGVAGALLPSLGIGDIVIAQSAVQHDIDTTPIGDPPGMISGPNIVHIPTDPAMTALLDQAAGEAGLTAVRAAIATGDQFIVGTEKKNSLARAFGAAACDMEGAAIAQCCYEMRVPYAAVRAISDTRDGDGREYAEKAAEACRAEEALLRRFLPLENKAWEEKHHG